MMTSTEMQTSLGRCQKLIRYGIEKGMTELELDQLIVYASALITLKADIHHVDRVKVDLKALEEKYRPEIRGNGADEKAEEI